MPLVRQESTQKLSLLHIAPSSIPAPMKTSISPILVKAGTLVDGENINVSPGGVLLERAKPDAVGYTILAADSLREIESHPQARQAQVIDRLDSVVCPALVNAHTHLDLTHIGPWRLPLMGGQTGGMDSFVAKVRSERRVDETGIRASVKLGIEASKRGGVVAVGDIAGAANGIPQITPFLEMQLNRFLGTSYVEFFAIGSGEASGIQRIQSTVASLQNASTDLCKVGIHPHAPYSVSLQGYRAALKLHLAHGIPICSHIAESRAEREFIAAGTGPFRTLLETIGLWNGFPEGIGAGRSPVAHISSLPGISAIRLVHLNDLSDRDIESLAPDTVAIYCPRSSEYFKSEGAFGSHRYRELLRRGIKVALGTDSLINLLDQPVENPRISTWEEMQLLHRRDGVDPRQLLTMATTWGAEAIGMSALHFQFKPGLSVIDLIGIMTSGRDGSLAAALKGTALPELLLDRN